MTAELTVYVEMDDLEIYATVTADMERCDYGVARSPVWYEPTNIGIETITIGDDEYTPKQLAQAIGADQANKIIAAVMEKAEAAEWGEPGDWYDGPDCYDDD